MPHASTACDLAVAITTRDNMRTIERCVGSVLPIASRILVVDSGSTDGTVEVCRALGCEVIAREWEGYALQKQFAIDECADAGWVLLLDSDESLEPDLAESMRAAVTADDPKYDAWEINRKVFFLGGWLQHLYQPEWRLRLVRGGKGRMAGIDGPNFGYPLNVHERLDVPGGVGRLDGFCRHDPWADVPALIRSQLHYAQIAAASSGEKGGTTLHLLVNPPAAMLKRLLIKGGFRDGTRGLIVAGLTYNFVMLKHALIAAQRLGQKKGGS